MNSPAQKIKERLSIEEVVSSYIKLEKAGANLKAKCPFHSEKTPSFFISPARGSYYCFGCGASGDIFSFVQEFEGLDFKGALKLLSAKAGVPLQFYKPEEENEKDRLYKAMEESARSFENNLKENKEALEYLKSRGLEDKTIKDFRIGFAKNEWRKLYDHLKQKNFTDGEIEKAGLAKKPEDKSKAMYDRFRGRIMFPISDSSGRIIAFSGRIFIDDPALAGQEASQAKYLNSPETPIFIKSAVLFGLDKAKESIRKNNFSILVEGQLDLILSHQAGYKNTVATSGTALSDSTLSKEKVVSNLGLVLRLSPNIVLAFDGDKAGFNATKRAGEISLSLGMDVKIASMPEGTDPADLISKSGVGAWREAIKNSQHIIEFILNKILSEAKGDERKAGREIKEKILPYVEALQSSIEKMHFIKKISDSSGVSEEALKDDLKKVAQDLKYEKKELEAILEISGPRRRKDSILRKILGIVLWQKTQKEAEIDIVQTLKELAEIIHISPEEILEKGSSDKAELIFEAEVFYKEGVGLKKDLDEMLLNLKEEYLKEELGRQMRELHLAEEAKDFKKSAVLLKECQSLNSQIEEIKNGRLKK